MACKMLVEFIGTACSAGMVLAMALQSEFAWLYDCDCGFLCQDSQGWVQSSMWRGKM